MIRGRVHFSCIVIPKMLQINYSNIHFVKINVSIHFREVIQLSRPSKQVSRVVLIKGSRA